MKRSGPIVTRLPGLAMLAMLLLAGCARAGNDIARPSLRTTDDGDWIAYGGDPFGSRWSPLAEISRQTIGGLEVAWTYQTGELRPERATRSKTSFEATPLVVDGTMYLSTPLGRVIALDPTSGAERWVFDPDPAVDRRVGFGDFTNRGVSHWLDAGAGPDAACARRIFIATIDSRLIALDARDGRACETFGTRGTVDMRAGLRNAPFEVAEYEVTSPPAVINDLVVVGSAVADNNRTDAASGEVRAYDARTGALRWTWDPVPQDSTDPAWRSWIGAKAHETGAANAWSVIAADPTRDLVFIPTGSASPDYFGGERLGDNRYSNSIVALRASTGRVVWHFQVVHHDLWDYDVASPPALVTVRRDGRDVPAVLQATKTGQLYVLHRETGAPIFPVEERAVPASDVPGERASPTQPFNSLLPALSPQQVGADDAWGPTAADRESCRAQMAALRNEGPFTPPSERGSLVYPSSIGGAHWGGVAFDPERQIVVVPVNRIAIEVQLIPREKADRAAMRSTRLTEQYTDMRGTPYVMRRRFLFSPSGMACTPPPFGALVAISLATGQKLWEVPLGGMRQITPSAVPDSLVLGKGAINLGGPIATAGGLVFVAATPDRSLRAFDIETGREMWMATLPAGGKATPMTYRGRDGRQYVVIAAGGDGEFFGKGDAVVAFRLRGTR